MPNEITFKTGSALEMVILSTKKYLRQVQSSDII